MASDMPIRAFSGQIVLSGRIGSQIAITVAEISQPSAPIGLLQT